MNNDIISKGNDFEVRKPLTYERFCEQIFRTPTQFEIDTFKTFYNMDLIAELEKIKPAEYEHYLKHLEYFHN